MASGAVVRRGGEPHAGVEAISARLRALTQRGLPGAQRRMQVDVGLVAHPAALQQRGRPG